MSIKSKSNVVGGTKGPLLQGTTVETVSATMAVGMAETPPSLLTTSQQQRVEQMYQLANIFASIFEALPDQHAHAIVTTREAA